MVEFFYHSTSVSIYWKSRNMSGAFASAKPWSMAQPGLVKTNLYQNPFGSYDRQTSRNLTSVTNILAAEPRDVGMLVQCNVVKPCSPDNKPLWKTFIIPQPGGSNIISLWLFAMFFRLLFANPQFSDLSIFCQFPKKLVNWFAKFLGN